jgi:hypothetical protein
MQQREPRMRFAADFPRQIRGFDFATLESDSHCIYALSADLRFIYFNQAWFDFAKLNGGAHAIDRYGLGSSFTEALPPVVRSFYLDAFAQVQSTGVAWHHDYECSAADVFRLYHQTAYALPDRQGLLVVNSLRAEHRPISDLRASSDPNECNYRSDATGLITQCVNCRRVQRSDAPSQWDWVPAWVRDMPSNITSGLCAICHGYYWRRDR